jgi:hypothetical protein
LPIWYEAQPPSSRVKAKRGSRREVGMAVSIGVFMRL